MIVFCRKIYRLAKLLPWLIYMGVVSVPVTRRKDKWDAILGMTEKIRQWGAGLLKIFNIHVKVIGNTTQYSGGLVVSNHLGYVDIFVHSSIFGLRFCPKSEIRSWPVLGWYTSFTHPIWIDRSSRMKAQQNLEEFKATLEHKVPLIVYPEGTSTDGQQILPFKNSPFELAAAGGFSIQPILTVYRVPEGADSPCWFTDIGILTHLWQLVGIPRIDCEVYILPEIKAEGRNRKELAEVTRKAIVEAHEKYVLNKEV